MRFESIAEAVERTPLVRLKNVEREYGLRVKLFVPRPTETKKQRELLAWRPYHAIHIRTRPYQRHNR